ncbi:hypothetical protein [Roseimaritima sediminicola]|uniref:hypothetical protein n=1 Tax=Roseimaritima sediminicola TaxID=2662066 RepID=UPI0012982B56|nr:hypothetical protein [Roseimaritima sediminicola]
MTDRQPASLIVLLETDRQQWFAGAAGPDGPPLPLMCSDPGNLDQYVGEDFDRQLSFLRHRLAGVLQRGHDRLYARQLKAAHFLFVADGDFPDADPRLTQALAEHFVQWMIKPPVGYARAPDDFAIRQADDLHLVAGELPARAALDLPDAVRQLAQLRSEEGAWELIPRPAS